MAVKTFCCFVFSLLYKIHHYETLEKNKPLMSAKLLEQLQTSLMKPVLKVELDYLKKVIGWFFKTETSPKRYQIITRIKSSR